MEMHLEEELLNHNTNVPLTNKQKTKRLEEQISNSACKFAPPKYVIQDYLHLLTKNAQNRPNN